MRNNVSTVSDFERFGFKREVLSEQTFNVLCVTKRNEQTNNQSFHQRISGKATVTTMIEKAPNGVSFARTVVNFNDRNYAFSYVRNGLSGAALVIGIYNFDDPAYTEWELYTDTPSAKPDSEIRRATPEQLRESAAEAVSW